MTSTGLQRYYEFLASQKSAVPIKGKGKERDKLDPNEESEPSGRPDSGSSSKKKKKKKGKGLLRLIEAYSRHVEGLQMIQ